jgi:hypothetical protein
MQPISEHSKQPKGSPARYWGIGTGEKARRGPQRPFGPAVGPCNTLSVSQAPNQCHTLSVSQARPRAATHAARRCRI